MSVVVAVFGSVWEARVHSHVCGDGHMYVEVGGRGLRYVVEYTSGEYVLVRDFVVSVYRAFGARPFVVRHRRGHYVARVRRKGIYFRLKALGAGGSREWRVPHELFLGPGGVPRAEIVRAWLGAFIDDEGYIDLSKRRVIINSVNHQGLKDVQTLLSFLGVEAKTYRIAGGKAFRLTISGRENIRRLTRSIELAHPKKKERLRVLKTWSSKQG